MQKFLSLFLVLFLLISCNKENDKKDFVFKSPTPEVATRNLASYLHRAPFKNEWNHKSENEDRIVLTNVKNVFPFLGKFHNANDDFSVERNVHKANDYYKEETLVFKDPVWGELFVHGMILYEYQPLFLKQRDSENANPIFSQNIFQSNHASLEETQIFYEADQRKSVVYWVSCNNKKYLLYFFQIGQLVGQVSFPCAQNQLVQGFVKLKEIEALLNPDAEVIRNASIELLEVNPSPVSFWKNPYYKICYGGRSCLMPLFSLRTKNTPFKNVFKKDFPDIEGDTYFSYSGPKGLVWLIVKSQKTKQVEDNFFADATPDIIYESVRSHLGTSGKIYVTQSSKGGKIEGKAQTYYTSLLYDNSYIITFRYGYPDSDKEAETVIKEILTNIR